MTRTFSSHDADTAIVANRDYPIAVSYLGSDPQGMRSVVLDYDMILYHNGSVTQPLLIDRSVRSSCPRETLVGAAKFDPGGENWVYEFAADSENWVGLRNRSARITVRAQ